MSHLYCSLPYRSLFMLRVLERTGIQNTYLNIIKTINSKPIANIALNGDKLNAVPQNLGQENTYASKDVEQEEHSSNAGKRANFINTFEINL